MNCQRPERQIKGDRGVIRNSFEGPPVNWSCTISLLTEGLDGSLRSSMSFEALESAALEPSNLGALNGLSALGSLQRSVSPQCLDTSPGATWRSCS
jgi:hypothetical protein